MIIAIIERIENIKDYIPFNNRYYLTKYYKDIFEKLNILLFPIISDNNLDQVCKICDGLIVTGSSNDINPKYYNELPIKDNNYDIDEFSLDNQVIKIFADANKPILGICGGLQSINVCFGGSLNQNILNHRNLKHQINISNDSYLNKIYNKEKLLVNSYHHQSIKIVAPNFNVSAISEDGIIEGIEKDNIIGVQWHPEEMNDTKFFEYFINLCKK